MDKGSNVRWSIIIVFSLGEPRILMVKSRLVCMAFVNCDVLDILGRIWKKRKATNKKQINRRKETQLMSRLRNRYFI